MKKITAITTYILFVMSFVFGLMSCGKKADTGRQQQEVYRYTVIDKSKDIGSHYNWFTDKQVVGTSYIVCLGLKTAKWYLMNATLLITTLMR